MGQVQISAAGEAEGHVITGGYAFLGATSNAYKIALNVDPNPAGIEPVSKLPLRSNDLRIQIIRQWSTESREQNNKQQDN